MILSAPFVTAVRKIANTFLKILTLPGILITLVSPV